MRMLPKAWTWAVAIAAGLAATPARAQQDVPEPQRSYGLVLNLGSFSGLGGGIQLGSRTAGLRASVGWQPLLVVKDKGNNQLELDFWGGLLVAPDLFVRLAQSGRTDLGAQLGYRYSSLLGHGGGAGMYVEFPVARWADVVVTGGIVFFPDGEDHLRREENLAASTSFGFPGPSVNLGLSIAAVLFP